MSKQHPYQNLELTEESLILPVEGSGDNTLHVKLAVDQHGRFWFNIVDAEPDPATKNQGRWDKKAWWPVEPYLDQDGKDCAWDNTNKKMYHPGSTVNPDYVKAVRQDLGQDLDSLHKLLP